MICTHFLVRIAQCLSSKDFDEKTRGRSYRPNRRRTGSNALITMNAIPHRLMILSIQEFRNDKLNYVKLFARRIVRTQQPFSVQIAIVYVRSEFVRIRRLLFLFIFVYQFKSQHSDPIRCSHSELKFQNRWLQAHHLAIYSNWPQFKSTNSFNQKNPFQSPAERRIKQRTQGFGRFSNQFIKLLVVFNCVLIVNSPRINRSSRPN